MSLFGKHNKQLTQEFEYANKLKSLGFNNTSKQITLVTSQANSDLLGKGSYEDTALNNAYRAIGHLPLAGGTLTGHLLFTDNTYDIGASGATRPRTGYFGTSIVAPTLNATTELQVGTTDLANTYPSVSVHRINNDTTVYGTRGTYMVNSWAGSSPTNTRFWGGQFEANTVGATGNLTHTIDGPALIGVEASFYNRGTGNVTNAAALFAYMHAYSSTGIPTIDNAYGLIVDSLIAGTAIVTNGYGIYIKSVPGTTKYGLYIEDTAPNFMAGSLTTPTLNGTTAIQLNGTDINTTGTLTNVAYKGQDNAFTTNQSITGYIRSKRTSGVGHSYLFPSYGSTNNWKCGLGINGYFNGTNWISEGDGTSNGSAIMISGTGGGLQFINIPSVAGTDQTITQPNIGNYYVAHLNSTGLKIGTGTATEALDVTGNIKASGTVTGGSGNFDGYTRIGYSGSPAGTPTKMLTQRGTSTDPIIGFGTSGWSNTGFMAINAYQLSPPPNDGNPSTTGNMKYFGAHYSNATQAGMLIFRGNGGDWAFLNSLTDGLADEADIEWRTQFTIAKTGGFSTTGNSSITGNLTLTGHLLFTDNTYDIGASGATRPRTGYFGTSIVAPTLNGTTAIQLNGTSINTAGTLTNVAYKGQDNAFTASQTIAGDVRLANASTDRAFSGNDNSGRILIGSGNGAGGENGASIYLAGNTYASNPGRLALLAGQQSETAKGDIIFRTGSSSQHYMTMNYLGNVRIGSSTDATEKLDVTGNIKASGTVTGASSVSSVGASSSVNLTNNASNPQVSIADITTGYQWYIQHRMDARNHFRIQYYNGISYYAPFTIELGAPNNSMVANSVGVGIRTAYSAITDALTVTGNIKASGTITGTTITGTQFRLSALNTAPASATATGTLGEIRIVSGFIYICVATNSWQRAAIAAW